MSDNSDITAVMVAFTSRYLDDLGLYHRRDFAGIPAVEMATLCRFVVDFLCVGSVSRS
ncbi:hypothetical protein D3C80_1469850 [compost metagenome]